MADERHLHPLQVYILLHLKRADTEYAKGIARRLKISTAEVEEALGRLEAWSLVERSSGSAIKRSEARFKLAQEVRKHHLYYTLTRAGKHLLRKLSITCYLRARYSEKAPEVLEVLRKAGCENHLTLARLTSMKPAEAKELLERLRRDGLASTCSARVLKRKHRRAKPKKETRTHHTYYRLSRMGELLLRGAL